MSKGLRLTENWLQRALWLVALAFATFLTGLGSSVVGNLGGIETAPAVAQFMDPAAAALVRAEQDRVVTQSELAKARLDQALEKHAVARANTLSARETFDNWLATRQVTAQSGRDNELVKRTEALDVLAATERRALAAVETQRQAMLDASQARARADARWDALVAPAEVAQGKALRRMELRVFGYRLALTLRLLLIAGWLFAKKRKGAYWPFSWGFIFFALFAFFFELVPYLPSYGGYVRYSVGVVLTVVLGRYAITALQRYLARQKEREALTDVQRRQALRYEVALARLGKGRCPGCERPVDLKDASCDYCPHCGIGLADHCSQCAGRKNAFMRFCLACGTPARTSLAD